MNPEAQRIALAELDGFVWYRMPSRQGGRQYRMLAHPEVHEYEGQSPEWLVRADGTESICNWGFMGREGDIPDYLNDLNAVARLEEKLKREQIGGEGGYLMHLWHGIKKNHNPLCLGEWEVVHATAAQRCEALLRTYGKWVETNPSESSKR